MLDQKQHIKLPEGSIEKDTTTLNLGPTHPATHGVFQNILEIDGERIVSAVSTVGYIHRAFEKIAERRPYYQITPLTDRLNYCSAPINNMGWLLTVEKLLGIETPKRVDYLRVIIMELARIADHLICSSVMGVDTGALTGFVYVMTYRELIYEIYEEICGSRLTTNIGRIGGFERNFTPAAFAKIERFLNEYPAVLKEFETLLTRNRIFMERTQGVGAITAERALSYGFTGPNLRAAGVDYDVRVANPYSSYQDFDFSIPVGTTGDSYDRFQVRNAEMWESLSIIRQAMDKVKSLPADVFHADVPAYYLPEKQDVYTKMEALIYHFKIVMGEADMLPGEVYNAVEGANGELGFYLISDGGRSPYRLHFRRPCFIYYQAYAELVQGSMLSDAIVCMSSLNLIAGELDA
ncbi:NADH-quinone oxidoreductase subunit D [Chitinophaga ginsengisegetis]|jgi:NADH-quinone oxidoreductase subunit D|uniref:NADH-quinone oxidoreductase subunit D n=1 Tax=Chitinophaga ginsengisegetis TaxID=393003 RepID=A0A1T5NLV7_9BACT|nr:NADH-quinone oxidoreductase subunit D [Chitinophaga ginsengisegetis]MDR6565366.1 NADH-quinone oxidoreductase subunit D [Chitinophaga ginsengisegetis]MDR6645094.1 NADH-quinone oxidoreductase subunit D [Chitinophaga ginsengisegetis]MDR6652314.1 NADH-quinone oxidoreductase subunit D [Chitinophaga ginsengisegetis]SKD01610.1 NADH-quinone oxidoreductase subunit D [Chitinophaga ginsengisegetis]